MESCLHLFFTDDPLRQAEKPVVNYPARAEFASLRPQASLGEAHSPFSILHYLQELCSPFTALCKIMENGKWRMLKKAAAAGSEKKWPVQRSALNRPED
jgi:hypothetical protein